MAIIVSINIYWSSTSKEWMKASKPEPVLKRFTSSSLYEKETSVLNCPAFTASLKNTYALKSIYSYNFETVVINEEKMVSSKMYDQKFFDEHVIIRSLKNNFFSFVMPFTFFTEEKSLIMEAIPPYLEDNFVTRNTISISGEYDIGKWHRSVEFPFFLRKDINEFCIDEEEVFFYVKFKTNKKINFIQYKTTEKIREYQTDILSLRNFHKNPKLLQYYYDKFSLKSKILKEIKENIVK